MRKPKFNWEAFWDRKILAPECDLLCRFRSCYHPAENKGSFTPGRGYTRYYDTPDPVCGTRHAHGCPHGSGVRGEGLNLEEMLKWAREHPKEQLGILEACVALIPRPKTEEDAE